MLAGAGKSLPLNQALETTEGLHGMNIFLGVSVLMLFGGGFATIMGFLSKSWPTTEAKIVESYFTQRRQGNCLPRIRYEYEVNGKKYSWIWVSFKMKLFTNPDSASNFGMQYPLLSYRAVSYSTRFPQISILEPGVHLVSFFIFAMGITTLLLLILRMSGI